VHTAHDLKSPSKPTKMTCRFSQTSDGIPFSDSLLQSPTSPRRYMRRGSKCPSMLMLPQLHFKYEENLDKDSCGCPAFTHRKASRRLSLVSLLAQELHETEIITSSAPPSRPTKQLNRQNSSNISQQEPET
jgi:hypothetical protein